MGFALSTCPLGSRSTAAPFLLLPVLAALSVAGCAGSSSSPASTLSMAAPSPDPRVGLRAGAMEAAGKASWNLRLLSNTPPAPEFAKGINSDMAFVGNHVIQGNFGGFQVWDVTNPAKPALTKAFLCPASQSDVSVYRNLLFVSAEDLGAR